MSLRPRPIAAETPRPEAPGRAVFGALRSSGFELIGATREAQVGAAVSKAIGTAVDAFGGEGAGPIRAAEVRGKPVLVASSVSFGGDQAVEMAGIFDLDGQLLARAFVVLDNDTSTLTLKLPKDGKPGEVVATASAAREPEEWVKGAEKAIDRKYMNGSGDLGPTVELTDVPAALRPVLGFIQRNTGDATEIQKVSFEGRTLYAMQKYECVSSVILFAPTGEQLFTLSRG